MTNGEHVPEKKSTPRELLNDFIGGEILGGSIKVNALADWAKRQQLAGSFYEDNRRGNKNNPVEVAMFAAVSETIRTRRFGENGLEYAHALGEAAVIVDAYAAEQVKAQGGSTLVLNAGLNMGGQVLLDDLSHLLKIQVPLPI